MKILGYLLCSLLFSLWLRAQDLGPHDINGQGCLSCHTTTDVDPSNVAATYKWGDLTTTTYTTDGGGTLTVSPTLTDQDPAFHSATCIVCHNGVTAEGPSMPGSSLTHNHPVDVPYPSRSNDYWPATLTASGISFAPSHFDTVYGRSIRFYISGGQAYIECSSCHDPHHDSAATVTINGQTYQKPTEHFVRGWYTTSPGSNSASQFCRSCHSSMANETYALNVPTN